ncbi:MAG TPA: hypothetical protein VGO83_15510 [Thermoleophilaceae bacterium]|nr:hypothetical protein [Thermoleophilaceae bacterium]
MIKRRPTPSMAVAFVALLAALSGTAVALPGTGTVDSGDLKDGAVKTVDIRKSAVTGAKVKNNSLNGKDVRGITGRDIKDNSLTGDEISEGTLDKVPSAGDADTLGGKPASAYETGNDTVPFSVRVAGSGEKTIATVGPFRVFVRCTANNGGTEELTELVMTTTDPNSAFDDNNGPEYDPWSPGTEAVLTSENGSGSDLEAEGNTATANAVASDGSGVIVHSYALGQNLGGTTDTCWAQGVVTATPAS